MTPQHDYSVSEQKLIARYGYINLMDSVMAPVMYRLLVEAAFMQNDTSEFADALRAANYAFTHRTCNRDSEEFTNIIEDMLYTDRMRIDDRRKLLNEYVKAHEDEINEYISINESIDNNYSFKWTQLVIQEIYMYNSLNEDVQISEFNDLCKRRGFYPEQKQFIIDAMIHIGLGYEFESTCGIKPEETITRSSKKGLSQC